MTDHVPSAPATMTATVTAAQIARLAGVGRAAVSNWRKRHPTFPEPVGGTEASPTFALAAVEAWLRDEGKLAALPDAEVLWRAVDVPGDAARTARAVADLAGVLLSGPDAATTGWDAETLAAAERTAEAPGAQAAVEALAARFADSHGREVDTGGATAALAGLLARLAVSGLDAPAAGLTVYDPSCGAGTLLVAAAREAPDSTLIGDTADHASVPLVGARLRAAGAVSSLITHGDALLNAHAEGVAADVVVSQPPSAQREWGFDELAYDPRFEYGMPPRGESELAWVQHALARLRPGGTAALVLPPAVAGRRTGRRIRAELLRRGAVRAVVALPAGSSAPFGIPLHLWVLRRPGTEAPDGRVLFVDRSDAERGTQTPDDATLWRIEEAWRAFREDRAYTGEPGVSAVLPVIGLLDDVVDLSPGRHVPRPDTGLGRGHLLEQREALEAAVARLGELIPAVGASEGADSDTGTRGWPTTTIGDLARAGWLTLPGAEEPLRAGDVVVPVLGGQAGQARVLEAEPDAEVAARGVGVLRVDPARLDPWFVAGFLRSDTAARQALSHASTSSRMDVRKVPLPRLPMERQAEYGAAFRRLSEFGDALRAAAETGERLVQGLTDALAEGTVAPG